MFYMAIVLALVSSFSLNGMNFLKSLFSSSTSFSTDHNMEPIQPRTKKQDVPTESTILPPEPILELKRDTVGNEEISYDNILRNTFKSHLDNIKKKYSKKEGFSYNNP